MASNSTRRLVVEYAATAAGLTTTTAQARKTLRRFATDAGKEGRAGGQQFSKGISGAVGSIAKKVAAPLAGLFALDKIRDFAKGAYDEAREAQKVGGQTNAVIKSTGGAARVTARDVGKLATAISNKTGIDDEAIQTGQNMLLTFTNIRNGVGKNNKIFDQATQIMTDMSVATGSDAKSAALQLGKALNDPVKGLSKLSKVGVTFTDQQKKQVEQMQKAGDTAGAQRVILAELQKEFGGSAAAQSTAGEKATNAWKNFQEMIGTKALPVIDKFFGFLTTTGIPAIESLINGIGSGVKWFQKWQGVLLPVGAAIGVVAAATAAYAVQQNIIAAGGFLQWLTRLSAVEKTTAAVQWLLNAAMTANPIGIVVVAIAALVAGFIIAYKKSETFRKIVQGALHGVIAVAKSVAGWFTGKFVPFFTKTLPGAGKSVLGWFKRNWPTILAILIGPIGLAVLAVVKNLGKITGAFTKAKGWVSGTWKKGWAGVSGWIGDAVDSGRDKASNALQGTRDRLNALKSWAGSTWRKGWANARSWLADPIGESKSRISAFLGSKGVQAVFNGLDDFGRKVFGKRWDGMKAKLTGPIRDAKAYFSKVFGSGGGGIRQIFSDAVTAIGKTLGKIKDALLAPIKDAISAINIGLIKGGINWILGKLGVPKGKQMPWIPVPKFGEGGRSRGRTAWQRGGTDRILALVDDGEHHMRTRATERLDRSLPGGLDYMNRTGRWPVGPAAETYGANVQAHRGDSMPIRTTGLPRLLAALVRRGPRAGEPAGYGANPLAYANSQLGQSGWYNRCLAFVNAAWNYSIGRFRLATARQSANAGPRTMAGTAPAGAAGYWDTGWAGHVALSAGDGTYYSNDVVTPGVISRVSKAVIDRWGPFMGWWSPTGAKGVPGDPGSLLGSVWDFLQGLSPIKWLTNKASAVGRTLDGLGGSFGAGLAQIPGFLVSRGASRLLDMFSNGGGQWFDSGAGVLPTGTSIVHNGTGRPEPLMSPDRLAEPQIVINVNGALDPVAVARQIEQLLSRYGRSQSGVQLVRKAA